MNAHAPHHSSPVPHRGALAAVLALATLVAFASGAAATTSESAAYGQRVDLTLTTDRGEVIPILSGPAPLASGAAPDAYDLDGGVSWTRVDEPFGDGALLSTRDIAVDARSSVPDLDDAAAGAVVDSVTLRLADRLTLTAGRITAAAEELPDDGGSCWSGTTGTGAASFERATLGGSLVPVPMPLPDSPEANHVFFDLPGTVTVTLNEQVNEDGVMKVHAVHIAVHAIEVNGVGTLRGDVYLGSTEAVVACGGADIGVTLVEERDPGAVGASMTYTAIVSNAGPERALDTLFSMPLSASADPMSATPSQGSCAIDGRTVTCSLGDVRVGETASVAVVVKPLHSGAIAIPADVASANGDVFPENNHFCEITTVYSTASLKGARMKVEVADSADPIQVGQMLTYTVTVTHDGGFAVPSALASFELPFGMWLMSVTPAQGSCSGERLIVCDLGTMSAGQQVAVTVSVLVMRGGALKATGVVSTSLADPALTDNCADEITQAEDPPA